MMAAPWISVQPFGDLCPDGIMMDVLEKCQKIVVPVTENSLVPTLEEMTNGSVFFVEIHGVALVDALEDFGKRNVLGFDQEMNMVAHENVCVEMAAIAVFVDGQKLKVSLEIRRIFEYFLSLITAGDDVVEGAVKLYPWFPRHRAETCQDGNFQV